jgi:hypothetical protein
LLKFHDGSWKFWCINTGTDSSGGASKKTMGGPV